MADAPGERIPEIRHAQQKMPVWLIVLAAIGIPLLLLALVAGAFLLFIRPASRADTRPALYADSLTSDQGAWECEHGATCQFEANGLHILAPTDHLYFSQLSGRRFDEQVIEVQEKMDNGDPRIVGIAIAFRSTGLDGYGFVVFINGTYQLVRWDEAGAATNLIPLTSSAAIRTGLNQINDLKVIARGAEITLFINGQRLGQVSDHSYSSGSIALGAARIYADAVFSNLTITSP
ncbi:MAG TPA: hypothetical protein VH599_10275 [Ktedonobacterales bacterium]|jgi:hypothetical protein